MHVERICHLAASEAAPQPISFVRGGIGKRVHGPTTFALFADIGFCNKANLDRVFEARPLAVPSPPYQETCIPQPPVARVFLVPSLQDL